MVSDQPSDLFEYSGTNVFSTKSSTADEFMIGFWDSLMTEDSAGSVRPTLGAILQEDTELRKMIALVYESVKKWRRRYSTNRDKTITGNIHFHFRLTFTQVSQEMRMDVSDRPDLRRNRSETAEAEHFR
jgi:hypothetical protein